MKIDVPLTARVVIANSLGISLGAVAALPLSSKIAGEAPKDVMKFGIAAAGGLSYIISDDIFASAFYEKYFMDNFKSVKNSNTDRILCGIGYLF
jgi:opacity protein-like surface antigen